MIKISHFTGIKIFVLGNTTRWLQTRGKFENCRKTNSHFHNPEANTNTNQINSSHNSILVNVLFFFVLLLHITVLVLHRWYTGEREGE
jgi:hypothetical protein